MADNGRWFKLWTEAIDDQHLDNIPIADFGRWAKFGAWLKKHGDNGTITFSSPAKLLCSMFQVSTFDDVISAIKCFPNVEILPVSGETNTTVTYHVKWLNWNKYQGDFSSDRVRKHRTRKRKNETPKKRREEKRKEETKKEEERDKKNLKSYLDFVLLSDKDHEKLVERFGPEGTRERISKLNSYIGQIGELKFNKKYASHYFCILRWYPKNGEGDRENGNTEIKSMKSALKRKEDYLAACDEDDPRRLDLEREIAILINKITQKEGMNA